MGVTGREPKFKKYSKVELRLDPKKGGYITKDPIPSDKGWTYSVFFSENDHRWVSEGDLLEAKEFHRGLDGDLILGDRNSLLRNLLLIKLRQPLADHLYSIQGSRTKFVVYQFKPAIKFLNGFNQRLLIADEVGLGKTIEAGIIYQELNARLDIDRVLVICPSGLRYKWQDELRSRFDEGFSIYDANTFRKYLQDYDRTSGRVRLRGIVSLEMLRRAEFIDAMSSNKYHFDLVIIDEAHHCRNRSTMSYEIASTLSDLTEAMLMLTATPLHLGKEDLFNLLHILDPADFDDSATFEERIAPNKHINQAIRLLAAGKSNEALIEMKKVEKLSSKNRYLGNPFYLETKDLLQAENIGREQMVLANLNLQELNNLSHIFTRTRKREVELNPPTRRANKLLVQFNDNESHFYSAVTAYVKKEFTRRSGSGYAAGWATIMKERQTASCIQAIRLYYENQLSGIYSATSKEESVLLAEMDLEEQTSEEEEDSKEFSYRSQFINKGIKALSTNFEPRTPTFVEEPSDLELLVAKGKLIGDQDSKFEIFESALQKILEQSPASRIMVFSYFLGTLKYLENRLAQLGYKVRVISGSVEVAVRQAIVDEFRRGESFNILLSSEVGSEGLDFQFCDTLFNYDLPWNPMKVEQRIGRLDRFGQPSPVINIYNLVIEDSIEDRIFSTLYERIGIFEESIGDLEEILGNEIRELSRKIFSHSRSPEEELQLAERAADNIIRQKKDLEKFEDQRLQFMGQDSIFESQVDEMRNSGRYLSEAEIRASVDTFIKKEFSDSWLRENPSQDGTFTLSVGHDFVEYLRKFIFGMKHGNRTYIEFLANLEPGKKIPLTFSSELAFLRKPLEYLNLFHPITQASVSFWEGSRTSGLPINLFSLDTAGMHSGDYYYFIYLFRTMAINEKYELEPIVISKSSGIADSDIAQEFMNMLQAENAEKMPAENLDSSLFVDARDVADRLAAIIRDQKADLVAKTNVSVVSARLSALEQAYEHRKSAINQQLDKITNYKILKMKRAQLTNSKIRYEHRRGEIEKHQDVSVTFSLELAGIVNLH